MPDFQPFVVTSDARDGSGLLHVSLSPHPEIHIHGEVLGSACRPEWRVFDSAKALLDTVVYRPTGEARAIGFKLFHWHAADAFVDVYEHLRQVKARVIHVQRRNLLEKFVSLKLAEMTRVWFAYSEPTRERPTLELDLKETEAYFERATDAYAAHARELDSLPAITVIYEELSAHYPRELSRIFAFLQVRTDIRVRPSIVKQERRTLPEIIRNYDEVEKHLAGTRWESFLDTSRRTAG